MPRRFYVPKTRFHATLWEFPHSGYSSSSPPRQRTGGEFLVNGSRITCELLAWIARSRLEQLLAWIAKSGLQQNKYPLEITRFGPPQFVGHVCNVTLTKKMNRVAEIRSLIVPVFSRDIILVWGSDLGTMVI
jgi:hypothetical protein